MKTRFSTWRSMVTGLAALLVLGSAHAATQSPAHELALTRVGSLDAAHKPAGVPDDYVVTPNGYFAPGCVQTLHAGDRLDRNGMIHRAAGLTEKAVTCTQDNFTLEGVRVAPNGRASKQQSAPPPTQNGYIMTANFVSGSPIGRIVASWTVPSQPSNRGGQTIYFFPGLEQLPTVQSILQPVLGWNAFSDKAWTLASWNCCKDGTTFHSDPISTAAGNNVVGDTYSNCAAGVACNSWNIVSRDTSTGQSTTLTTDPYADLTWVFGGALEVYSVDTCDQFPGGPLTFHDIQVYDRNFTQVSTPWGPKGDTSGINPQCGYGLSTSASTATFNY